MSSDAKTLCRPIFKKTKLCKFFRNGMCNRLDNCMFAHTREELLPLPDFSRTKMCPNICDKGWCERGAACTFAHSTKELRTSARAQSGRAAAKQANAPQCLLPAPPPGLAGSQGTSAHADTSATSLSQAYLWSHPESSGPLTSLGFSALRTVEAVGSAETGGYVEQPLYVDVPENGGEPRYVDLGLPLKGGPPVSGGIPQWSKYTDTSGLPLCVDVNWQLPSTEMDWRSTRSTILAVDESHNSSPPSCSSRESSEEEDREWEQAVFPDGEDLDHVAGVDLCKSRFFSAEDRPTFEGSNTFGDLQFTLVRL